MAGLGVAPCFALNATSLIAVIAGLYLITPGERGEGSIQRAALALLFVIGWAMASLNASVNSTLQISTDDLHRGRVMSAYAMVLAGVTPLGSILAGTVA